MNVEKGEVVPGSNLGVAEFIETANFNTIG